MSGTRAMSFIGVIGMAMSRSTVRMAEGAVEVKVPQLRDALKPYVSRLIPHTEGLTSSLEHLVQEMYVRGLSTRDIEDLFGMLRGSLCCLGRQSVR